MTLIELYEFIVPLLLGCATGSGYAMLFLLQHRQLVWGQAAAFQEAQTLAFFLARILMLWILGSYLLHRELIVSILALVGFISIFWLTLLLLKARSHERI